jgi:hypothetical protein
MTGQAPTSNVILRRYPAVTYESALDLYEADLPGMAEAGWVPVGQVWGWDPVGSAGWMISGSSWKPGEGTLAVTYRREPRTPSAGDQ